jgi:hypothetical protein
MTERKPPEMSVTSWVDQQISEAAQRGAFDNLPGAGQPLPHRSGGTDAWLQDYLRREGVSAQEMLPTPLRLRKEIERLTETVHELPTEQQVRELVTELNRQIMEWRRIPVGPPVLLPRVDADAMVTRWRAGRPGNVAADSAAPGTGEPAGTAPGSPRSRRPRSRWWRRTGRGGKD